LFCLGPKLTQPQHGRFITLADASPPVGDNERFNTHSFMLSAADSNAEGAANNCSTVGQTNLVFGL